MKRIVAAGGPPVGSARGRPRLVLASLVIAGGVLWACAASAAPTDGIWPRPVSVAPARPPAGIDVPTGGSLQAALDQAADRAVLRLAPGIHDGPVRITRPVTLWGTRAAVIRSPGTGTTVEVRAPEVNLLGFTIEGSGRRFDLTDAAVSVRGNDCRVEGLFIHDALFGITVEGARRARICGNEIVGTGESDLGLRGDAVRFWEVRDSEIAGNLVTRSRDLVVWYSPGNTVARNFVEAGRYGTHFMYSHHNRAIDNTYLGNLVGIFVMYSDTVEVRNNRMAFSDPTGGMGLGIKESGELGVRDNVLLRNQSGIYIDTSPLQRSHRNAFAGNRLLFCDAGVTFHSSETNNRFLGNEFRECGVPVRIEGDGDAAGVEWVGNHFDDYQGYDLDGDRIGDVPYELYRLSDQLTGVHQDLGFFAGTPALALLDLAGHVFPLLTPRVLLRDQAPRTDPLPDPNPGVARAH